MSLSHSDKSRRTNHAQRWKKMSEFNEINRTPFEDTAQEFSDKLTFGQKIADSVAKFGGSWTFVITFCMFMAAWITVNSLSFFHLVHWDKPPFILLNLILSCIAALQAPVIMMSQNRQAEKDRATQQEDREVNRQAELEIRNLKRQITELQKSHEEERREQTRLLQEIRNSLRK